MLLDLSLRRRGSTSTDPLQVDPGKRQVMGLKELFRGHVHGLVHYFHFLIENVAHIVAVSIVAYSFRTTPTGGIWAPVSAVAVPVPCLIKLKSAPWSSNGSTA